MPSQFSVFRLLLHKDSIHGRIMSLMLSPNDIKSRIDSKSKIRVELNPALGIEFLIQCNTVRVLLDSVLTIRV